MPIPTITPKQIAVIHVAKARCGLSDTEYRDLLASVGAQSSKDLTRRTFERVMRHFETLGFRRRVPARPAASRDLYRRKIETVMRRLGLTRAYVDAMARHMFGVDAWPWCTDAQLGKLVAALTYHQRRQARRQHQEGAP